MNPWWIGIAAGAVVAVIGIVFAAGRVAAEGGAEITVFGTTVKTGNTAALALVIGLGFMGFSIYQLAEASPPNEEKSADPQTERFAQEVKSLLGESRETLIEIGEAYGQMDAAKTREAIRGRDLELALDEGIDSRRQSREDAEDLEAPPQARRAKATLVEAFGVSYRYDLKLAECRSYGLDEGIDKAYRSCLKDVRRLGAEASKIKHTFFDDFEKAVGRPLTDTSLF